MLTGEVINSVTVTRDTSVITDTMQPSVVLLSLLRWQHAVRTRGSSASASIAYSFVVNVSLYVDRHSVYLNYHGILKYTATNKLDPTRPDPWVDPIHGQLWFRVASPGSLVFFIVACKERFSLLLIILGVYWHNFQLSNK